MNATADLEADASVTYGKIMWRIMPFLLLLYLICYIDRVNIGFAKLQFLTDLGLNNAQYGLATGLFFVTYSLFDIPSNLMLSRIGVRKTLLRIMVMWGLLTSLQAFIRTAEHLYILRILFGAAEAGFIPGIMLYMTYWFPNYYRARVVSLFLMAVPLSGVVGAPISGAIMQHLNDVGGLRGWQWLFVLEGIPAIILGIVAFAYLDDRPSGAKWLTKADKERIERDIARDRAASGSGNKASFSDALRDPFLYAMALMNFAVNAGTNAVSFWTPTLLKSAGLTDFGSIGLVTGGISTVAAVAMLLIGRNSDRTMERRWHFAACGLLGAGALLMLPLADHNVAAMTAVLTLAATGNFCVFSIYWAIPTSYLQGRGAAGGIALASMVGAFGSGVSPTIIGYFQVQTGSLYVGLAAVAAIVIVGVVIAITIVPARPVAVAMAPATR
jgi:D-galactonate transporter